MVALFLQCTNLNTNDCIALYTLHCSALVLEICPRVEQSVSKGVAGLEVNWDVVWQNGQNDSMQN